jgi:hypothetical protein
MDNKKASKPASILVSDDVSVAPIQAKPESNPGVGHNSRTVAPNMVRLAINEDDNHIAMVALIKAEGESRDDESLASLSMDYRVGKMMNAMGMSEAIARATLRKGKFITLPNADNGERMSLKETRIDGAARTGWSRLLDRAFGKKEPATKTDEEIAEAKAKKIEAAKKLLKGISTEATAPKAAPITVASLIVERATTKDDVVNHVSALLSHIRAYQKQNAKLFIGDEGAAVMAWLLEAPSFGK